jgi:polyisoprenoid-binding protein YceI
MTATTPTTTLPLTAGKWSLDKNHSSIHFVVRHLGLSNVRGRFDSFESSLDVGKTLESISVSADVELSSVDTNNADRDAHLRNSDFFDTDRNQTMTFRSTAITGSEDEYQMVGDLTLAGVTKPVTFDVEFNGTEVFPGDQSTHAGFTATGQIKRSDFGVDFGIIPGAEKLMLGDKIKVELDIQFVAPAGS